MARTSDTDWRKAEWLETVPPVYRKLPRAGQAIAVHSTAVVDGCTTMPKFYAQLTTAFLIPGGTYGCQDSVGTSGPTRTGSSIGTSGGAQSSAGVSFSSGGSSNSTGANTSSLNQRGSGGIEASGGAVSMNGSGGASLGGAKTESGVSGSPQCRPRRHSARTGIWSCLWWPLCSGSGSQGTLNLEQVDPARQAAQI